MFHLQIVTPDGSEYDGEAKMIIVRTTEGDLGILEKHADLLAPLAIGEAKIYTENGIRHASCAGGMISVNNGIVRVVAVTFEWADEIDIERAKNAKKTAEETLKNKKVSDYELKLAEFKLKRALNRIKVSKKG